MSEDRAVELIFDASDSMNKSFGGSTRIAKAKEVLQTVVTEDLPDNILVALRVFGAESGCSSDLKVPLAPLNRNSLRETIGRIQAVGSTPIAASLAKVKDDLASVTGKKHVVLVTDGLETCDGDVEATLEKLKDLGIDVRLDVVGITDPGSALEETFEKWAKSCGGAYTSANDSDKLHKALKELLLGIDHAAIVQLKADVALSRSGLDLLKKNMYKYNPNESAGKWSTAWATFKKDYLPAVDRIGDLLTKYAGHSALASVESAIQSDGFSNWKDYWSDRGIAGLADRISTYCPQDHLRQYDCIKGPERLNASIKKVEAILDLLSGLS
jgi:hypothetical protein